MAATHDRRSVAASGLALVLGGAAGCSPPEARTAPARAPRSAPPRAVVSLNPCLDVILVEVADRGQIAALSHYARDRYGSTIADVARTLPSVRGSAEEVIALEPDLVLAPRLGPATVRSALERVGLRVALFDVPETVAASLDQVREIGRIVGHPARGLALVARIEGALAASAPTAGTRRPSALVFMPGGFASGPGTLMDEMMTRAGLTNAAARYGLTGSMNVPLERLVADPPEILLSGEPFPGAPSWAERIMTHPALAGMEERMRRAAFPERLLFCGGPVLIQTAAALSRARRRALERRP